MAKAPAVPEKAASKTKVVVQELDMPDKMAPKGGTEERPNVAVKKAESNPETWQKAGAPHGAQLYSAICDTCGAHVEGVTLTSIDHFKGEHVHP